MANIGSIQASPAQNGLAFQNALLNATPGSTLTLQAGAQFLGPFVIPAISGTSASQPITVQSSALSQLPAAGQRIDPSDVPNMPTLLFPSQGGSTGGAPYDNPYSGCGCINFADGAAFWNLIGLEVACQYNNPWSYFGFVLCGNNSSNPLYASTVGGQGPTIQFSMGQTTLAQQPKSITLNRLYIHGPANIVAGFDSSGNNLSQVKGGVELHADTGTISGCYINNIAGNGFESHGLFLANGVGNYQIINNFIACCCENIFCGGVSPALGSAIPYGPSNVTLQGNHLMKWLHWCKWDPTYDGNNFLAKNLAELKAGRQWTIDSNILENSWGGQSDQLGWAFLLTPRGTNGTDYFQGNETTCVQDITISNNLVINACGFLDALSSDDTGTSGPLANINVFGNLAENMRGTTTGGHGTMVYLLCGNSSASGPVSFHHNTFMASADGVFHQAIAFAQQSGIDFPNFTFEDNICVHGSYAQFNALASGNTSTFGMNNTVATSVIPNASVLNNVFVKQSAGDTDVNLGVIGNGVYQAGSDNNANPLVAAVGFNNPAGTVLAGLDYRLQSSSPFAGKASDGGDPGANQVDTDMGGGGGPVTTPAPVTTPTATTTTPMVSPPTTVSPLVTATVTTISAPSVVAPANGMVTVSVSSSASPASFLQDVEFETGDFSQCASESNATIVIIPVMLGKYCARLNRQNSIANIEIRQNKQSYYNLGTAYYRFYFLYTKKAMGGDTAICNFQDTSSNGKCFLHLDSLGRLVFYDMNGTKLATGTTALASVMYYIEAMIGTGANASWAIRINGQTEISGSGNLSSVNNGSIKLGGNSPYTDTFCYDSVVVSDSGYPGPAGTSTVPGSVSLSIDKGLATTQTLTGGTASFVVTSPAVGTHQLLATYAAQQGYGASQASGTLTVTGTTTLTATFSGAVAAGTYSVGGSSVTLSGPVAAGTYNLASQ